MYLGVTDGLSLLEMKMCVMVVGMMQDFSVVVVVHTVGLVHHRYRYSSWSCLFVLFVVICWYLMQGKLINIGFDVFLMYVVRNNKWRLPYVRWLICVVVIEHLYFCWYY